MNRFISPLTGVAVTTVGANAVARAKKEMTVEAIFVAPAVLAPLLSPPSSAEPTGSGRA